MKKWCVCKPDDAAAAVLTSKLHIPDICAQILTSRGILTLEAARSFLNDSAVSDPLLMKDMEKAVDVITEAVENGEKICVYGDYDCDGITATVILFSYLECMGADVCYYIPEREEGYGLNAAAVRQLNADGVTLIVTVDNGISAFDEAQLIYDLGMRLVVTDHHSPSSELPHAEAVVDPHRADCLSPCKDLCGCAVALKLIAAMEGGDIDTVFRQYADLAAVATIADIVPLTGENRTIVRYGLDAMQDTNNEGLAALMSIGKIKTPITSTAVAFGISPRINASGRFGSPSDAAALLLSEDSEEAGLLAKKLDSLNAERKKCESDVYNTIIARIDANPDILANRVLCFCSEGWHHGVIGIAAAKITERYGKPCFIASEDKDEVRGSARSVEGFSIYDALSACSQHLTRFGGHVGAGGFSLTHDNVGAFFDALQDFAKKNYPVMPKPVLKIEKLLVPSDLDINAVRNLERLAPFGAGNSQPVFLMRRAVVEDIAGMSSNKHTKLVISYGGARVQCPVFGMSPEQTGLKKGDVTDICVTLEINSFAGRETVNAYAKDWRSSDFSQTKFFAAKDAYEAFIRNEEIDERLYARICPTREELETVYKTVRGSGKIQFVSLCMKLASESMNYCKVRLICDIFAELKLMEIHASDEAVSVIANPPRAELDTSELLQRLRKLSVC